MFYDGWQVLVLVGEEHVISAMVRAIISARCNPHSDAFSGLYMYSGVVRKYLIILRRGNRGNL